MTNDWNQSDDDGVNALYSFNSGAQSAPADDAGADWAALVDYSAAPQDGAGQASAVQAFDAYQTDETHDAAADFEAVCTPAGESQENDDDDLSAHLATVTNPTGSVTVTAMIDGSIMQVDLTEQVTTMSESDLADEIMTLSELARKKGLANQHAFLMETMESLGANDPRAIREFLEEGLNLNSPEQAAQAQAETFSARYHSQ